MLLLLEARGSLRALWSAAFFAIVVAITGLNASVAQAQLKVYYDPLTGNVALDTTNTRSGALYSYGFSLNGRSKWYPDFPKNPPWLFSYENMIRLTNSTLYLGWPDHIGESTVTTPVQGLFTIGEVMPAGLSEEFWTTAWVKNVSGDDSTTFAPYVYSYADMISEGPAPPAEFIYGAPAGEFDNKWDIVDPETLPWATTATLIYRAWSGELLLDTTGEDSGYISHLLLKSSGAFLPEGYTPFTSSFVNTATSDAVYLTGDAIEPGQYSFGQILQPGLSAAEFENLFTEARFIGRAGFNGGNFDFAADGVAMSLQFVPEPSALLLMALGAPLLALGRQRPAARR